LRKSTTVSLVSDFSFSNSFDLQACAPFGSLDRSRRYAKKPKSPELYENAR
jgi:hypothetical protein